MNATLCTKDWTQNYRYAQLCVCVYAIQKPNTNITCR